jgi:hypothetical protein
MDRKTESSSGSEGWRSKRSALCLAARRRGTDRLTFHHPAVWVGCLMFHFPAAKGRFQGVRFDG